MLQQSTTNSNTFLVNSFRDLDYTFAGFLPFKYYSFMCVNHPFYFDEQRPKLGHWTKETYRFRAYVTSFHIKRNQGLPAVLFHLGLKQSLETADFLITPKNYFFSSLSFSKEYLYLSRNSWAFAPSNSLLAPSKDWFYVNKKEISYSFSLLESLFQKRQRRFWRDRIKGVWNKHLQIESLFYLSGLHSTSSLGDLAYKGMSSSSYHFSFFTNSFDRRTLILSPVRFFYYKYKRLLATRLYRFSFFHNFRKFTSNYITFPSAFTLSYSYKLLFGFLDLYFYFLIVLFIANFRFVSSLKRISPFSRPLALSFSSSFVLFRHCRNYFLPKAVLLHLNGDSYSRRRLFLKASRNLISTFKPYLPASVSKIKRYFALKNYLARTTFKPKRRPKANKQLWLQKRLYLRFSRSFMPEILAGLFEELRMSSPFASLKRELHFKKRLLKFWNSQKNTSKFFDFKAIKYENADLTPEHLRKFYENYNKRFVRKPKSRSPVVFRCLALRRKIRKLNLNKSLLLLFIKFFIVKLFYTFLSIQKSNSLHFLLNSSNSSLASFFTSLLRSLSSYFLSQRVAPLVFPSDLALKLQLLENFRQVLIRRTLNSWHFAESIFYNFSKGKSNEAYISVLSGNYFRRLRFNLWRRFTLIAKISHYLCRKTFAGSYVSFSKRKYIFSKILSGRRKFSKLSSKASSALRSPPKAKHLRPFTLKKS